MQTAFQSNAFQAGGFQVVANAAQPSGGWITNAWHMGRRPVLRVTKRRPRRKRQIAAQIARLERHIAQERNVSRETVRLEADTRKRHLPPTVLLEVERAMTEQTQTAIRAARIALERYERDEEEEFAVLW